MKIDQTIFASDPNRMGNCVSACVATYLSLGLEQVPHFLEVGKMYNEALNATRPGEPDDPDKSYWWCHWVGFMAGYGLHPFELESLADVGENEIAFVAGKSDRGVLHQVLYRNGELWHDPHPSRTGVLDIVEVLVWRPATYDHTPTSDGDS